ncbi:MAG: hypothetical protein AB8D78_10045 [Akkermansiaceae bacterium]
MPPVEPLGETLHEALHELPKVMHAVVKSLFDFRNAFWIPTVHTALPSGRIQLPGHVRHKCLSNLVYNMDRYAFLKR